MRIEACLDNESLYCYLCPNPARGGEGIVPNTGLGAYDMDSPDSAVPPKAL